LIQGSVQPPPLPLARTDWERAMIATASPPSAETAFAPDGPLLDRVAELIAQKYSQRAYNEKR
jgi:hypothetical protein